VVVDERGLGGGKEMEGISWHFRLHELWERYVEAEIRREAAVRAGRCESVGSVRQSFPSLGLEGDLAP
jgi:hypothetical protein